MQQNLLKIIWMHDYNPVLNKKTKNKKRNTELLAKRLESVNFIYFEEYGSLLDENSRLTSKVSK